MMILAMLQDGVAKEAIAKYAKVSVEIYHRIRKKESLIVIPYNKIYAFWATYDVYLHI